MGLLDICRAESWIHTDCSFCSSSSKRHAQVCERKTWISSRPAAMTVVPNAFRGNKFRDTCASSDYKCLLCPQPHNMSASGFQGIQKQHCRPCVHLFAVVLSHEGLVIALQCKVVATPLASAFQHNRLAGLSQHLNNFDSVQAPVGIHGAD